MRREPHKGAAVIRYFNERSGWRAEFWKEGDTLPGLSVSSAASKAEAREAIVAVLERDSAT